MRKILLIEDNDDIRENTSEILQLANYKVYTAENGKAGVELALREQPELIICDIMMPVLDGYEVLHMLQKNDVTRNTPFIFLTAKAERPDFRKGMELGVDDYITKPFNGIELLNSVERRLNKVDLLKEQFSTVVGGIHELFEIDTGKDVLLELATSSSVNKYKKKQVIFQQGNRPSYLYFLRRGKVKTYKTNDEGKVLVMGLFNEKDFFGHIALLENANYRETAEAIEETELAIIPRADFEELVNNNQEVSRRFIQLLARNVSEKEDQLLSLAYNSLRKKVADALTLLYRKYGKEADSEYAIEISRENLAAIAGTATESLIRTLSDFRVEKLIDIREGSIIILDQKRLQHLVN